MYLIPEQRLEDFNFQQAQFAVGDDQEVAAAARRIEEAEGADFAVELPEQGLAAPGELEFLAQVVHEERVDNLEDVALGGVVPAGLAAFRGIHHALEERAEDGGRNGRPVELGTPQQCIAHSAVETGECQTLFEQLPVDVREGGEHVIEMRLSPLGRGVQHLEELC